MDTPVQGRWAKISTPDYPYSFAPSNTEKGCQESPSPGDCHNVEYSQAVNLLGLGKFHVSLALSCGVMFLAAGMQNNLNAYILPSIHCDLHISSAQMGLLNAVFLAGGISSNLMWGVIADMMGRRTVVVYGMFADGLLTLASSLSQRYSILVVFRFFNGLMIGGPVALVFAYLGEFFPDRARAKVICYVGAFWVLSWVVMPALAWLIIPLRWSIMLAGSQFNSWRLLMATTALPSLLSAALLIQYPESPRFLLVQGKDLKALASLAKIYSINNNKAPHDYPVKSLRQYSAVGCNAANPKSPSRPVAKLLRQIRQLFAAPTNRITALASFLFFSNMFGYYGLGLWLPELFQRLSSHLQAYPEAEVSLCSASHNLLPANSSMAESTCNSTDVDTGVFTKSVVMGLVGLLGNVISGVLAGLLKRRTLPVILMGLSATCVLIIHFTTNMALNLVLASAFQLTIGAAYLVYDSLVVDMFPPHISGMGVCMANLAGRLGGMISNLVFGQLLDVYCSIPIFLVSAVLFAGSFASVLIPSQPFTEQPTPDPRNKKEDIFVINVR